MYTAVKCTASARILPRIRSDAKRACLLAISTVTHALARKGKNLGPSQVKSSQVKLDFEFNSVLILVFPVERRFRHEPSFWSLRVEARLFVLDMKTRRGSTKPKKFPPHPKSDKAVVCWRCGERQDQRRKQSAAARARAAHPAPAAWRSIPHASASPFIHTVMHAQMTPHTGQWPHAYTSD